MLRNIALLMLAAFLALNFVAPATACNGRSKTVRARRVCCPPRPAPPAKCKLYCICTPDANGVMRVQGTTTDRDKAKNVAEILKQNGIKAWAMEMKPVPKGGGLTLSNGEAAMAIAFNIGPGKTRAAAIGKCGRAEAIAEN